MRGVAHSKPHNGRWNEQIDMLNVDPSEPRRRVPFVSGPLPGFSLSVQSGAQSYWTNRSCKKSFSSSRHL